MKSDNFIRLLLFGKPAAIRTETNYFSIEDKQHFFCHFL